MQQTTANKIKLLIVGIMLLFLLSTVGFAAVYESTEHAGGNAADFTVAYPWIVVGLVAVLFLAVTKLVNKYDQQREDKIDRVIQAVADTHQSQVNTAAKLDAAINTLFDRDRTIEEKIAKQSAMIARLQANCNARSLLCPVTSGDRLYCLERRDTEKSSRRKRDGHDGKETDEE